MRDGSWPRCTRGDAPRLALTVAVGTRPEVVKLAPVVAALRDAGHEVRCVATGQHADPALARELLSALGLRPDARVGLPDGTEGDRVGGAARPRYRELAGPGRTP